MIKNLLVIIILVLTIASTFYGISFTQQGNIVLGGELIQSKENNLKTFGDRADLVVGDLIFCELKPGLNNIVVETLPGLYDDHVAMYVGNNRVIHSLPRKGVVNESLTLLESCFDVIYGKVIDINYEQRLEAVRWAEARIGSPYSTLITTWDYNVDNSWYCSELVWAAYYNLEPLGGIDLCGLEWDWDLKDDKDVWVYDLLSDFDISHPDVPPVIKIIMYRPSSVEIRFVVMGLSPGLQKSLKYYRWDFTNDGVYDTDWSHLYGITLNCDDYENEKYTIKIQAIDDEGITGEATYDYYPSNHPPNPASKPVGPINGVKNRFYTYSSSINDPDGDDIYYKFIWDYRGIDYKSTFPLDDPDLFGPCQSGKNIEVSHMWSSPGNYSVCVLTMDKKGEYCIGEEILVQINATNSNPKNVIKNILFSNLFQLLKNLLSSHFKLFKEAELYY